MYRFVPLFALVACAAAPVTQARPAFYADSATDSELAAYPGQSAFDVLRMKHGRCFWAQGSRVQVWIGTVDAGPEALQRPALDYRGIRCVSTNEAFTRFGSMSHGPAIVLYPRAGR